MQGGIGAADYWYMPGRTARQRLLTLWRSMPKGGALPHEVWSRRHRGILVLLWVHSVTVLAYALLTGRGWVHALLGALPVAVAAVVGGAHGLPRFVRSGAATLGLVTASAALVHLSGGYIEAHIHVVVMVGVIGLYQDYLPFLLAVVFVAVHHGTMGALDPGSVYNHPDAILHPWKWAMIHSAFVLAASAVQLVSWRMNEETFKDPLTGLADRHLFEHRVHEAAARTEHGDGSAAVLFIDLDDFKAVNKGLGHAAGDSLLISVGDRLRRCVRAVDTVGRLGADEFAILLDDADAEHATGVALRILDALDAPFVVKDREVFLGASIGIAVDRGAAQGEALLRNADTAMDLAKRNGKRRHELFDGRTDDGRLDRLGLHAQLRRAIDHDEFRVHYQPTFDLATGELAGVEALVRWQHPERGVVPPSEFVPLAELTGLIVPIGRWVLEQACEQVQRWNEAITRERPLTVSVNLSARQLRETDLVDQVAAALARSGLPPELLVLEMTESVLVEDAQSARQTLERLKRLGVGLAIDDFGTGYSSLSYLRRFPVDILKIDRTFVTDVATGPEDAGLARAIVKLGHTLGLLVVAEGIETPDQLAELEAMHCDRGQGYHLARPLDPATMQAYLLSERGADRGLDPAEPPVSIHTTTPFSTVGRPGWPHPTVGATGEPLSPPVSVVE
ncbi:MAG TPA: EAL domain-containing protein [Nitriliruptorales bacterium]|nr:EAL domain-containing protein [Nitriliruptorales bacterium]